MLMEARLLDERREGEAVGIAKGKEIGLVEGEAKEKLATAKRLFSMGLSVQDIAKVLLSRLNKFKLCKLSRLANNRFAVKQKAFYRTLGRTPLVFYVRRALYFFLRSKLKKHIIRR